MCWLWLDPDTRCKSLRWILGLIKGLHVMAQQSNFGSLQRPGTIRQAYSWHVQLEFVSFHFLRTRTRAFLSFIAGLITVYLGRGLERGAVFIFLFGPNMNLVLSFSFKRSKYFTNQILPINKNEKIWFLMFLSWPCHSLCFSHKYQPDRSLLLTDIILYVRGVLLLQPGGFIKLNHKHTLVHTHSFHGGAYSDLWIPLKEECITSQYQIRAAWDAQDFFSSLALLLSHKHTKPWVHHLCWI